MIDLINKYSVVIIINILFFSPTALASINVIIGASNVKVDGDMDGLTSVSSANSTEILPAQDKGKGYKIGVGFGGTGNGVFDIAVVASDHDGQWLGIPTESEYLSCVLDYKYSVYSENKFKGLLIFGLGFTNVKVIDGSISVAQERFEDATFKGIDYRLGVGVSYKFHKKLTLELNTVKRFGDYNSVDGIESGSIEDLEGGGLTTSLELKYSFD